MSDIPIPAPEHIATLVELLRWRVSFQPDALALSYLPDGVKEGERLTYGEIDRRARIIAVQLRQIGAKDERVLLVYPPGFQLLHGSLRSPLTAPLPRSPPP